MNDPQPFRTKVRYSDYMEVLKMSAKASAKVDSLESEIRRLKKEIFFLKNPDKSVYEEAECQT